jgi:hypothetical protein
MRYMSIRGARGHTGAVLTIGCSGIKEMISERRYQLSHQSELELKLAKIGGGSQCVSGPWPCQFCLNKYYWSTCLDNTSMSQDSF